MHADALVDAIAARVGRRNTRQGFRMPCPAHGGDGLSLHVWSDGDHVRVYCFSAGCDRATILDALERLTGVRLAAPRSPIPPPPPRRVPTDDEERRRRDAAARARALVQGATVQAHPYLSRKGFPSEVGLVDGDDLIIPVYDARTHALLSVERIDPAGGKRFLAGGRIRGGCYRIGPRTPAGIILVEGYATGLSVAAAMRLLYLPTAVVVCFAGGNLAPVCKALGHSSSRVRVVADNDESGAGLRYALETRAPYWVPPERGDANDYHQAHGADRLARELQTLWR